MCVAVMGQWFPKRLRGVVLGLWSTAINTGNLMGIGLAHVLNSSFELTWYQTYAVTGGLCLVFAVLVMVALVPHPSAVSIEVAEEEV